MLVYEAIPPSGVERFDVSPPDYLDLVQYQHSFAAIGAYRTLTVELSGGGQRRNRSTPPRSRRRCSARSASPRPRGAPFSPKRINRNRTSRSSATRSGRVSRPFATRVGDRPRSQAVHGGWCDAGRIRIPAPRRIIERDSRGRLTAANLHAARKTGPRDDVQAQRHRPAARRYVAVTSGRRDLGAGHTHQGELPWRSRRRAAGDDRHADADRGPVGSGTSAADDPARGGRPRAARHVRQRGEPGAQPLGRATARHRHSCRPWSRTPQALPGPAQRSVDPFRLRRAARSGARILGT